ncbi:MAG: threonine/serine exporter family protein, partial [Clostridium perfringens]
TMIIGSIMLLVPGLSITNAIRDTIAGDLISGLIRAAEAFLVAISIAVGTGMVMSIWIYFGGGI